MLIDSPNFIFADLLLITNCVCFFYQYLEEELGIGALRTMKRIKSVIDPNNIMNPGKLIPPHVCL
jgi:FAD linked oxidases, C-terminal domain